MECVLCWWGYVPSTKLCPLESSWIGSIFSGLYTLMGPILKMIRVRTSPKICPSSNPWQIVFYFGERRNVFKNICQTGYRFLFFGVYIGFGHGPNSCSPNPEPLSWPKWNELNLGSNGIDYWAAMKSSSTYPTTQVMVEKKDHNYIEVHRYNYKYYSKLPSLPF